MSLKSTILFSLSIVFLIIGFHQTFIYGIAASYFLYMFSILFLFLFMNRKKKENEEAAKKIPEVRIEGKKVNKKKK